jgi:DNA-binding NtrC family response regulator
MLQGMVGEVVRKARAGGLTLCELVREVRRQFIIDALDETKGNQFQAAKLLQMHRNTLSRQLDELDINTRLIRREHNVKKPVASIASGKGKQWQQG